MNRIVLTTIAILSLFMLNAQEDGKIEWKNNFDKLYQEKSYENPKCLNCKYLPVCMGICPRDHAKKRNYCKMDAQDSNIETSLIDFIEHCK